MALPPINPTNITPPRVALIDPRTGAISREWYRFFLSLRNATQDNQQEVELAPDTSSLLATYDTMLTSIEQASAVTSDGMVASLESNLNSLQNAFGVTPPDLGGTVTSVAASGGTTGLTFSGSPITTSGTLTLGGTLNVANGGTGATTFTSGYLVKGNGTSAISSSVLYDNGTNIGLGTTSPSSKLDVNGKVSLTGGEDNQLQWANNGQTWRINNSSGGQIYIYNVTSARFPFKVDAATASDTLCLTSTGVGVGTGSPNASAILDVQSTTQGLRLPNMTTTQKNAISSPAAGLMVFDTTLSKACVYSGSAWETITSV